MQNFGWSLWFYGVIAAILGVLVLTFVTTPWLLPLALLASVYGLFVHVKLSGVD